MDLLFPSYNVPLIVAGGGGGYDTVMVSQEIQMNVVQMAMENFIIAMAMVVQATMEEMVAVFLQMQAGVIILLQLQNRSYMVVKEVIIHPIQIMLVVLAVVVQLMVIVNLVLAVDILEGLLIGAREPDALAAADLIM